MSKFTATGHLITGLLVLAFTACAPSSGNAGDGKPVIEKEIEKGPEYIHPDFTFTEEDMNKLVSPLPDEVRQRINSDRRGFLHGLKEVLEIPEPFTILVDKQHPLPADYAPDDLVHLKDYGIRVNVNDRQVSKAILPDLKKMVTDAAAEGVQLTIISAFRSYRTQEYTYKRNVEVYGKEAADRESAQPGKSQHQLGTTIDINSLEDAFGQTPEGLWLAANAWKYGFSLSYPPGKEQLTGYKYEPWHFRYITPAASRMEQLYFGGTQQYFLEFLHENREMLRSSIRLQEQE